MLGAGAEHSARSMSTLGIIGDDAPWKERLDNG